MYYVLYEILDWFLFFFQTLATFFSKEDHVSLKPNKITKNHHQPKEPRSHFEQLRNPKSSGRLSSSSASSMATRPVTASNRLSVATTTATDRQNKATTANTTTSHQEERGRRDGRQRTRGE